MTYTQKTDLEQGTNEPLCEGLARETKKGVQTYSMLDNKVSPSQERCWLSNRVQLLETKVTALWL